MYRPPPSPRPDAPPPPPTDDLTAARLAMVARLEASGELRDPAVRAALSAVRREVLLPRAYVRRNEPGARPGVWQLLDGAHPEDRAEWSEVVHGGGSVLVQHDGERVTAQRRGMVAGGRITGLSSVVSMTVHTLQRLRLRPGLRLLELGTGTGVTAALAAHILGPGAVTSVESDRHLADAARARLDALGSGVRVVTADGLDGCPDGAPYDRVLSTFAVPYVPRAWLAQLADGGLLLTTVATTSSSWSGEAVVRRRGRRLEATLEGRAAGHLPVAGHRLPYAGEHRHLVGRGPVRRRTARVPTAELDAHGYRGCSQCTGLQPGGEANLRTALTSAVSTDPHCSPEPGSERPVLLLDVLLHDAERRAADGP
uniref:methyltransferase domain-containing protein n=1 Tax=Streptomyces megasporus TaxID=44060 RepID=UPI0012FEBC5A